VRVAGWRLLLTRLVRGGLGDAVEEGLPSLIPPVGLCARPMNGEVHSTPNRDPLLLHRQRRFVGQTDLLTQLPL
jgi:hypothetical protein